MPVATFGHCRTKINYQQRFRYQQEGHLAIVLYIPSYLSDLLRDSRLPVTAFGKWAADLEHRFMPTPRWWVKQRRWLGGGTIFFWKSEHLSEDVWRFSCLIKSIITVVPV